MPLQPPSARIYGTTVTFMAEDDVDIIYTMDGREPTAQSLIAQSGTPIELGQRNLILKAAAVHNGERSPTTTTLYIYTPRPLIITPEDGIFDGHVNVTFQSEHDDIRYTVDGSIPSLHSAVYDGPFALTQEGTTVVTAAMFVNDRQVGAIARRTYEIAQPKLEPPVISPESGNYTLPLRITMTSSDEVRYTLDSSEPSMTSLRYTQPIILLHQGDVHVRGKAFPRPGSSGSRRPSEVVSCVFHLALNAQGVDGEDDEGQRGAHEHPMTVLPVGNYEFSHLEEALAADTAEKTVGMLQATQQVRQDVEKEHDALVSDLREIKREHRALLERLDAIQRELGIAAARKAVLQGQVASQSEVVVKTNERIESLQQEQLELKQQLFSVNVEVNEAEHLLRRATCERQGLLRQREILRKELENAYLDNKRKLTQVNPHLVDEVSECSAVVAEQRHEIWLLEETLKSLRKTLQEPAAAASEFLQASHVIDLAVVETFVPIPRGKMRLVTGASGNGLHKLRDENKVQASIVRHGDDDQLCLRVYGHAKGVHNLIAQVGRVLNE